MFDLSITDKDDGFLVRANTPDATEWLVLNVPARCLVSDGALVDAKTLARVRQSAALDNISI